MASSTARFFLQAPNSFLPVRAALALTVQRLVSSSGSYTRLSLYTPFHTLRPLCLPPTPRSLFVLARVGLAWHPARPLEASMHLDSHSPLNYLDAPLPTWVLFLSFFISDSSNSSRSLFLSRSLTACLSSFRAIVPHNHTKLFNSCPPFFAVVSRYSCRRRALDPLSTCKLSVAVLCLFRLHKLTVLSAFGSFCIFASQCALPTPNM
ncbi:hypothetical protein R3P38DRAFT_1118461 [Favolaschia claudopus]|uniref:Uncharacterized protein n=1 Tax=Favolaschia claudopus TaxID=2862362 RepID=A0AAW0B912_9AGAR